MCVGMIGAGFGYFVEFALDCFRGRVLAAPTIVAAFRRPRAPVITPAVRLVARPAPAGAALDLVLGVAMCALFLLDQRLTVGDRDLVVVGMNFRERQEAMAIAAVVDEGGLERRLYARDLGEIDIAAQLAPACGLKVELFDPVAA